MSEIIEEGYAVRAANGKWLMAGTSFSVKGYRSFSLGRLHFSLMPRKVNGRVEHDQKEIETWDTHFDAALHIYDHDEAEKLAAKHCATIYKVTLAIEHSSPH